MTVRKLLLGVLALCYPVAIYFGLQHWSPRAMALVLVALALVRALTSRQAAWRLLAVAAAVLAAIVAVSDHALPLKLYPVLVNSVMLGLFGWSLRYPPSLVERLARLREPGLPPAGVAYTRRVTQAWCVFFVCNGALSAVTAVFASDRVWALYNGGVAYALIGAMFAGEWLVRQRVMARGRHG
ncbi:COG4648 family protein [Cupriavidus basilensis]|uniref:COG4648 family protein n=1 Tax=Cupriavidus basilensis TaxID=68895 RepID=UPI0023E7BC25|nr:hypothetical protein [Cupriavidus basilensis]MDF3888454.1 hypothetical protein [Cupriavidus basilensis]